MEFKDFLLEYWYVILVALYFLFPVLSRIQDCISGKAKRHNQERLLAEKECLLSRKERELAEQAKVLEQQRADHIYQSKMLMQRKQHLDDLIRCRTIDMARNVASRDYLCRTPAFSGLLSNDENIIPDSSYYSRLCSVLNTSLKIIPPFDISANILSDNGNIYHTTLYSCSCPDFKYRKGPCKHMFRLAIETGLLMSMNTTPLRNDVSKLLNQRDALLQEESRVYAADKALRKKEQDFDHLLHDTKQTYPWLAASYADFLSIYDKEISQQLLNKARNIEKVKDMKKALKKELRTWRIRAKEAEYQLHFYETLFPWLLDFKEVPPVEAFEYAVSSSAAPQEDQEILKKYLSPEEYTKLSSGERFQLALDRYIEREKSAWEVGIEYERYIGYLCELQGYRVTYSGAIRKLEDMGRDLILEKENKTVLIQCKRWAKDKQIHEKHVFQLTGSTYEYQYHHPEREVIGVFVTTASFSPVAAHCAERLNIPLFPETPFNKEYPRIKCNISKGPNGEVRKIYHLPMDQQYDTVRISSPGEFYAATVQEAEAAGFRRAYRWRGSKSE